MNVNKRKSVSDRHDLMGVGIVDNVLTHQLYLDASGRGTVLVNSCDTLDDGSIDMTKRFRKGDRLAFKALRRPGWPPYLATVVRPLSDCIIGEGIIDTIAPGHFFIRFMNDTKVFSPRSGILEPDLDDFLFHMTDLRGFLRGGDPVTFVAIEDSSTIRRSAYAVEVAFLFNDTKGLVEKPKLGVIIDVDQDYVRVWAQRFPSFHLTAKNFGVDGVSLCQIFHVCARIRFNAPMVGCDPGQMSDFEPIDGEVRQKLNEVRKRMVVPHKNVQKDICIISPAIEVCAKDDKLDSDAERELLRALEAELADLPMDDDKPDDTKKVFSFDGHVVSTASDAVPFDEDCKNVLRKVVSTAFESQVDAQATLMRNPFHLNKLQSGNMSEEYGESRFECKPVTEDTDCQTVDCVETVILRTLLKDKEILRHLVLKHPNISEHLVRLLRFRQWQIGLRTVP